MIGHLLRSADFERVLGTPMRARTTHFALHFLAGGPARSTRGRRAGGPAVVPELSTGQAPDEGKPVDDLPPEQAWLGTVVPKRHARRSVTRNLLKRQIRAVAAAEAPIAHGLWVVRLRAPFDKATFPSAASTALRQAAAGELRQLFARVKQAGDAPARR
jgi:ribonuclease P protein component